MKLEAVEIENYRAIEHLRLPARSVAHCPARQQHVRQDECPERDRCRAGRHSEVAARRFGNRTLRNRLAQRCALRAGRLDDHDSQNRVEMYQVCETE